MSSGDPIPWSYIAQRIAAVNLTATSGTWSTGETTVASVTGFLTTGQRYKIRFLGFASSTVAADLAFMRIREDTLTGNQLQGVTTYIATTTGNGFQFAAEVEFVAIATANKTFVATGSRASGTGTGQSPFGPSRQGYLTLDLVPA